MSDRPKTTVNPNGTISANLSRREVAEACENFLRAWRVDVGVDVRLAFRGRYVEVSWLPTPEEEDTAE